MIWLLKEDAGILGNLFIYMGSLGYLLTWDNLLANFNNL